MGALSGLIAHHPAGLTSIVELALLGGSIVLFGAIWLRERRRRADRMRRIRVMRD